MRMCDSEEMADEMMQPTLWRTCRVLANRTRLRILSYVLENDPTTVTDIMRTCAFDEPKASRHLRLLQSRGLLMASRSGRHVFYVAKSDPLVGNAPAFLAALRTSFNRSETATDQIRALTAFTHPRRISIVLTLTEGPTDGLTLCGYCNISPPALYRHLRKLLRRGILTSSTGGSYALERRIHGLAKALVALVVKSKH